MPSSALAPEWLSFPEDSAALHPVLWSSGVTRREGEMTVQNIGVSELAHRFSTPLLVVDEDDFRARARAFRDAFNTAFDSLCGGADVYYASKSFLTVQAAQWVNQEGLFIDTASGGELAIALRAGVDAARIGLHGNNKSDAELRTALEVGVGRIVVDSLDELNRLVELTEETGITAAVMLRLTPGIHAHTHDYIATAHEDQKFGLPMSVRPGEEESEAHQAVRIAVQAQRIQLNGVHCHIGSQIFEADGFGAAAHKMLTFLSEVRDIHQITLPELDLGGGYGIAYTEADTPREPHDIAGALAELVRTVVTELDIDCPRISIEPGRAISGPAGMTLYTAGVTKTMYAESGGQTLPRRYVAVDGGMSDNPRPVLYDADYSAALANRVSTAEPVLSRVVGKHCESGDILVRSTYLPEDVGRSDLIAVPATGAYCHVMSSNYNMLPRPAVVAVRDGEARLIIRAETEDDLFAREIPEPGQGQ